jgi:hypothetical protein
VGGSVLPAAGLDRYLREGGREREIQRERDGRYQREGGRDVYGE